MFVIQLIKKKLISQDLVTGLPKPSLKKKDFVKNVLEENR